MQQKTGIIFIEENIILRGFVKEFAIKISNYIKQEIILLTDEEIKFYKKQKVCRIFRKEFSYDKNKENEFRLYQRIRDHRHYTGKFRGTSHNICNLR